jgi:hypothetical protein
VCLVIDDEHVFHAHEIRHDALDHLALGLGGFEVVTRASFEELLAAFGEFQPFAQLEGVVVGDDDLGLLQIVQEVGGNEFAGGVLVVGVVRL